MKDHTSKTALLVSAVAALFVSGAFAGSVSAADAAKVKCYGINGCKGQGACGGKGHSCAGQNACKGKGYLELESKDECLKKGGALTDPEKKS